MRRRLDAELVRRGLVRSREQAVEAITTGRVMVAGMTSCKPATLVEVSAPLTMAPSSGGPPYASRGAHKLAAAVATWSAVDPPLVVAGRRCLDAGASTGGFTDVLLRAGAAEVVAVDVGYGQLLWRLRSDSRVRVLDRRNVRTLTPDVIGGAVDLAVADLSFISLRLVLPALACCTGHSGDLVVLVKPQFEVGRAALGRGGVVRDPQLRAESVARVAEAAACLELGVRGVLQSPLPGPAGNVEFLLWLARGAPPLQPGALSAAMAGGTQGSEPEAAAGLPQEEA